MINIIFVVGGTVIRHQIISWNTIGILQAVEKLQKRCIMRFTETEMHIICNEESEDGVQVWS